MAREGAFVGREDVRDLSYGAIEGGNEGNLKRREFSRSSRGWIGDSRRLSALKREYAANLYNFAWAQAVQNKPLVSFAPESVSRVSDVNLGENVESEEKEEGEIEEGEIDEIACDSKTDLESPDLPPEVEEEIDFDSLVVTTLEELEAIDEEYAEQCFEEACTKLSKTLDSLHKMFSENSLPSVEALVEQAITGVRTVYSVFLKRNDQGRDTLFRLLSHMKNRVPEMFTPGQLKEVDEMMEYVASVASTKVIQTKIEPQKDPVSLNNDVAASISSRIKVEYHPLLDLHSNHDGDSLPSPTREGSLPLPDLRLSSEKPRESVPQELAQQKHSWEKDGTNFSTYQQKYSRTSFLPSDELPSPTPSEECNGGDGDLLEVSSSSLSLPVESSISTSLKGLIPKPVEKEIASGINLPGKASLKSRDPRLKHAIPTANDISFDRLARVPFTNPKKHGFVDQTLPINPILKRQKHEVPDRNDLLISTRKDDLIADNESRRSQMGLTVKEASVLSSSSVASLLSLLKDVAEDPSVLTNLIKEKHRLAIQAQPDIASMLPAVRPTEVAPSTSCPPPTFSITNEKAEAKTKGVMQMSRVLQDPQDGVGRIRMKSRDPRRILHSNILQKSEHDQLKAGVDPKKSTVRDLEEHAQVSLASPQSTLVPNAPKQVNICSKSLSNATPAARAVTSQVVPTKAEPGKATIVTDGSIDQQPSDPWGDMDHLLDGYDEHQKATIQRERARRIEEQNRMIADRKLCLVLDLDHTLLNSAKFSEVDPVHEEILRRKEEQDREKPQRSLFRLNHMGMWTKLRPGIWSFLERASKLFELHLYTMGNKLYATEMAKVLDRSGTLFAGRVISKGDEDDLFDGEERLPKSKDLDGVLGMESAVVIIDDSVKVWPHHKLNLIVVERYTYFPCSRRQFGMPGPSLLEIDHDERLEDGTLASSLGVIERIHGTFFAAKCPGDMDVRNIIASEQRRILSGCRIVFSRIFPVGEAKPHLHPLWQIAEQFGATCTNQIDDQATHVVAYALGTDKVNWALSTGRFVVHPGWVEASALLYRRANEVDFAIKPFLPQPA